MIHLLHLSSPANASSAVALQAVKPALRAWRTALSFAIRSRIACIISRRDRDGAGTWIPGGLNHCSHKIKLPSRIVKLLLKINLRGWTNVADLSMHTISATFVQPRKCIFSNSFTILEASATRVADSISICFTKPHCLHFSRRARDGAGAWILGGLSHSSHRTKPPCFVRPKAAMPACRRRCRKE